MSDATQDYPLSGAREWQFVWLSALAYPLDRYYIFGVRATQWALKKMHLRKRLSMRYEQLDELRRVDITPITNGFCDESSDWRARKVKPLSFIELSFKCADLSKHVGSLHPLHYSPRRKDARKLALCWFLYLTVILWLFVRMWFIGIPKEDQGGEANK